MTALEVLMKYLKPWAYDYYGDSIYVGKENVSFIRQKMKEHGVKCHVYVGHFYDK